MPAGIVSAKTMHGFAMEVLAEDLIGRHIILSGRFDFSPIKILRKFSQDYDSILDVGANIGYVSCFLLQNLPNSVLQSVEPQPELFEILQRNLSQFDFSRSKSHNIALSDKTGSAHFNVSRRNLGGGKLVEAASVNSFSVTVRSTSEFLAGFSKLDILKIDVEGHELSILANGESELTRLHPRAILMEDHTGQMLPDGQIGRILSRMNYEVYGIRKRLNSTKLIRITRTDDSQFTDYIAVSKTREIPPAGIQLLRSA